MLLCFLNPIEAQTKPNELSLFEFQKVYPDYLNLVVDSYTGESNHIIVLDYSEFNISEANLSQYISATEYAINHEYREDGMVRVEINSVTTSKLYLLHEVFYKNGLRL